MPVTAKLSQRFYQRFGDELTNELVDWFNAVDATYRSDLRDLNEINFARFDAKLEQRFAQFDAKWEQRFAQFDAKWEQRFAQVVAKWEQRFAQFESKVDQRFALTDARIDALKMDLEAKMGQRFSEQRETLTGQLSAFESRMTRWMVGLWTSTMLAMVGLLIAILRSK
jgi:exonuclease VII large subunit